MKHAVALFVALFSMLFLMGDSCDSGDFTTSYFCCGTGTTCTSIATQCPANDCSTGLQTFPNGQNECATLQDDGANSNCAVYSRFGQYFNIGCSGTFTENPAIPGTPILQPTNPAATPGPGTGVITFSWSPPAGTIPGPIVYTILYGTAPATEGFYTTNVTANSIQIPGLTTSVTYYFLVTANLVFAGNLAAPGTASVEVSALAP